MSDWCCNVLFCTNEARSFGSLAHTISELCRPTEAPEQDRISGHWMGLGRFDHVVVSLAKKGESLLHPETTIQNSSHATSHWACFGRVIRHSFPLDQARGLPTRGQGLLGVCGIKLAHLLRDALSTLDDVANALAAELEALTQNGAKGDWLITSTTGWEDLVLLFWTNEFATLSKALGKVRGLRIADLPLSKKVEGVHAVLTTCTLAGLHLPDGVVQQKKNVITLQYDTWLDKLARSINPAKKLDWALRFELRPGHLDSFHEQLQEEAAQIGWGDKSKARLDYKNLLGQYDYLAQCEGGTQEEWLSFLLKAALPLAIHPGSLVRSMETRLHIELPGPHEAHKGKGPKRLPPKKKNAKKPLLEDVTSITAACHGCAIAAHTIDNLKATYNRLLALRQDDIQHDTFISVENLFLHFDQGLKSKPGGIQSPTLDDELSGWLQGVERSLADRYRGTYPLGEAVVTRLGTYQASHHGFLAAMDCIAQETFDLAQKAFDRACPLLEKEKEEKERTEGKTPSPITLPLPHMAVCSFIGSSPILRVRTFPQFMRSGFIELPASMVFQPEDLPVLLHEVGHMFIEAVSKHCRFKYFEPAPGTTAPVEIQDPSVLVEIQEILAETFASCACFDGTVTDYFQKRQTSLKAYLPIREETKFSCSSRFMMGLRLSSTNLLLEDKLNHEGIEGLYVLGMQDVEVELNKTVTNPGQRDIEKKLAQVPLNKVIRALRAMMEIRDRVPAYDAMISAMQSLRNLPAFSPELIRALDLTKTFIRSNNTPAGYFLFIEEMVSRAAPKVEL